MKVKRSDESLAQTDVYHFAGLATSCLGLSHIGGGGGARRSPFNFPILGWTVASRLPLFFMSPLRRHIFVCFMAKSAFWRGFAALAPYTGVEPI